MSFEKIFYQYQKMVFNLALQYTQNIQDAEEITQDVFVKISKKYNEFRNESSLKTWIYKITINQSLDFIKNKNAQKRHFLGITIKLNQLPYQEDPAHFNHPGVLLEQKEKMKMIFGCINRLPPQQKTALILMKIEGKSQSETAEIMEMSIKAIESLMQRAKKNLEILLKQNEGL